MTFRAGLLKALFEEESIHMDNFASVPLTGGDILIIRLVKKSGFFNVHLVEMLAYLCED